MNKLILIAFLFGILNTFAQDLKQEAPVCISDRMFNDRDVGIGAPAPIPRATSEMKPTILKIVKAKYTAEASKLGIHGTVVLDVVFHADRTIGQIRVITRLPNGLMEEAIEAAKKIIFKPAEKDGTPISVRMSLEYDFNIEELGKKRIAIILSKNFKFLSAETREYMVGRYEKFKIGSKEINIRPLRDEARGLNLLASEKREEFMKLRAEGIENLCPSDQEAYLEIVNALPKLAEHKASSVDEFVISRKVERLFGFRHAGIRALPIEQQ